MNSLPLSAFAAIAQSLLLHQQRLHGGLPVCPVSDDVFLDSSWQKIACKEEYLTAWEHLLSFFMTGCSQDVLKTICLHPNVSSSLQELKNCWDSGKQQITFYTSGSTGVPKACTHDFKALFLEAQYLCPYLKSAERILSTVPCHHLYGFTFSLLLPLLLNKESRRTMSLPSVIKAEMQQGDAVVSVPAIWEVISQNTCDGRGKIAVTATAPISSKLLSRLFLCGFSLLDIYGSSETSVAGIRTCASGNYELPPYDEREGMTRIIRKIPGIPVQNHALQDYIIWDDPRHFLPHGRLDHAVQVAGINVYPQKIADTIKNFHGVKDCAVRLMRQDEGSRLKAFIVCDGTCDEQTLKNSLSQMIKKVFPPEERPVKLTFGESLPVNEMNKLKDW